MVGAADLAFDHFALRQVGAEMRAPRALRDRLAGAIAISDDARADNIDPKRLACFNLARERHRKPRLVKARRARVEQPVDLSHVGLLQPFSAFSWAAPRRA
jgi:hypothetical protein